MSFRRIGARPQPERESGSGRVNSLGLDGQDLESLLDSLDGGDGHGAYKRRDFVRWPFRHASLRFHILHSDGSAARIQVACRNLSCGGMSILHSAYLHCDSKCVAVLEAPDGELLVVRGQIAHCKHLRGVVHEIGVQFDDPIDIHELVSDDPVQNYFSLERIEPGALQGDIVAIISKVADQRTISHYLRPTALSIQFASNYESGLSLVKRECHLVLVDLVTLGDDAQEMLKEMRKISLEVPIILIGSDLEPETRRDLLCHGASAILDKPLIQDLTLRAIAEFLMVRVGSSGLSTTLPEDDERRAQVPSFIEKLHRYTDQLTEAIERDDALVCRAICLQICSEAPPLGFEQLGDLAHDTATSITHSMSAVESMTPLRELIAACTNAQANPAVLSLRKAS